MKIPSVTQERTTPTATVPPETSLPDDTAPSPRPVIELPGEDDETISIIAPPPGLLDRLQAEAATTMDDGTATADELARQLSAAQRPLNADAARAEAIQTVDTSLLGASTSAAIPASEAASPDSAAVGPPPTVPTTVDDRQSFKVVLRLKPVADNRWHATIGIGRDGCDPFWEGSDVDDWPEALDSVLGVHAAAEARWAEQPRNPRPTVTPSAPVPVAATGAPSSPSAKTGGTAGKAKAAAKSNAAPPSATTTAASAPPPTPVPAPLPPLVPATDPAPTSGVEKLTLF
jgi:hypothetical protein